MPAKLSAQWALAPTRLELRIFFTDLLCAICCIASSDNICDLLLLVDAIFAGHEKLGPARGIPELILGRRIVRVMVACERGAFRNAAKAKAALCLPRYVCHVNARLAIAFTDSRGHSMGLLVADPSDICMKV